MHYSENVEELTKTVISAVLCLGSSPSCPSCQKKNPTWMKQNHLLHKSLDKNIHDPKQKFNPSPISSSTCIEINPKPIINKQFQDFKACPLTYIMEKIAHIQLHYTHELTLNYAFLCSSENFCSWRIDLNAFVKSHFGTK